MNATSSRSHGVFSIVFTQKRLDNDTDLETEKVKKSFDFCYHVKYYLT